MTCPRPDGRTYDFVVNSAGIRSNREYSYEKPPGVFRILIFGESQAAGIYQSNEYRFSELLEKRNPGLEVINFSLPGTGSDQQMLTFEHIGHNYEHDLIILIPFLMTIRRNVAWSAPRRNTITGKVVYAPKPRFELSMKEDGTEALELRNVPVPELRLASNRADDEAGEQIARHARRANSKFSPIRLGKKYILPLLGWLHVDPFPLLKTIGYDPYPEYESPDTEEWRLMAAIIKRFAALAHPKPFVIAPLVSSPYMRFSLGRSYWDRFTSLIDGERIYVIDLLPHFTRLGRKAIQCFLEPIDPHLSDYGHAVLADAVEAELRRFGLLPLGNCASQKSG